MTTQEKDYPVKVGTFLFTMVEPHPGHEVPYNRWYEHDHFYSGCLVGPNVFAGDRFVATRRLKDLRSTAANDMTPDPLTGSYLAIYWVLDGHHDEWNRWAVDQVNWLHANGRMFEERQHVHTLLYHHEWSKRRDPNNNKDSTVPRFIALKHVSEPSTRPPSILGAEYFSAFFCDWTEDGRLLANVSDDNRTWRLVVLDREGRLQ